MSHHRTDGEGSCTGEKARRLVDAALVQIGRGPRGGADEHDDHDDDGDPTRRDFLAAMGFSLGAVGLAAGCRAPVQNAIPLPVATPEMVPGVALHFATTCGGCSSACALLVKQRDGRPIKIDGNPDSPLFGGGTCATGQASLLSLYDGTRLRAPTWQGRRTTWADVDARISARLAELVAPGADREGAASDAGDADEDRPAVVLLSGSITSPSTRAIIAAWARRFPRFRHVVADPVSASALREATLRTHGRAVVPHFSFDRARVVVALEADFLGTWLSPVEFARAYAAARRKDAAASAPSAPALHVQIESGYSVTGGNADQRFAVPPSAMGAVAAALYARVARQASIAGAGAPADPGAPTGAVAGIAADRLDAIAAELWRARGTSLVVSGSADVDLQTVVAALNALLGNVGPGRPVDVGRASLQRQGDDRALHTLIDDMAAGHVGALFLLGVNPGYDLPDAPAFIDALKNVPLSVSFASHVDETSAHVQAICPDHHFLESWGDAEPVEGTFSLAQPLIAPLFATRAAPESLLRWLGESTSHYDFVRAHWRETIFPRLHNEPDFDPFWDRTLQRGVLHLPRDSHETHAPGHHWRIDADAAGHHWRAGADAAAVGLRDGASAAAESTLELHTFESVALRDGRHAANPWLQELPDPLTRTTWGNVAALAPALARRLGIEPGDVVALTAGDRRIELPAFVQAGQDARTVSVALGHGRAAAGATGSGVGVNAFVFGAVTPRGRTYGAPVVTIARTGRRALLPTAQEHLSMEDRPIALTTTTAALRRPPPTEGGEPEVLPTLWKERLRGEHAWGMAIDLDACTGCSACVVACQVENNVPVVGKDQVQRNRIMHWLRIDRYFATDADGDGVSTLHQPMMCQHCGNAPCETVCPVLATTTGSEGLNQQIYNRCIGTRYCANNCPYKVRRFNWLAYTNAAPHASHMEDPIGRLVLNPDVTVRTRGVMEKCSLCVQRIQLGKNQALQQRRAIADGDVQTACQQSCPTGAIVFGDLMDDDSRVARLLHGRRAYQVLADLGTRPNVGYLKRVRRPAPGEGDPT